MFPVDTRYLDREAAGRIEDSVAATVRRALAEESGSALVFLPGVGEIRRVEERLDLGSNVDVAPLYGDLSPADQDRAIAPSPAGRRKVVLATSIAETSLTIEGVRLVIDCGLMRVPRFSPRSGMTRLETVRVSQASADQRRGRAGRLEPGVCYRLWPRSSSAACCPSRPPEILDADLAPLALELALWGANDATLPWLTPPPPRRSPRRARAAPRSRRARFDGRDHTARLARWRRLRHSACPRLGAISCLQGPRATGTGKVAAVCRPDRTRSWASADFLREARRRYAAALASWWRWPAEQPRLVTEAAAPAPRRTRRWRQTESVDDRPPAGLAPIPFASLRAARRGTKKPAELAVGRRRRRGAAGGDPMSITKSSWWLHDSRRPQRADARIFLAADHRCRGRELLCDRISRRGEIRRYGAMPVGGAPAAAPSARGVEDKPINGPIRQGEGRPARAACASADCPVHDELRAWRQRTALSCATSIQAGPI
jgi:hypothetical protein